MREEEWARYQEKREREWKEYQEKWERQMNDYDAKREQERQEYEKKRQQEWQDFEKKLEKERLEREAEWKREKREMNKMWGELANKMGTLVEDIVAPNIKRIAVEQFGVEEIIDFSVRRIIKHSKDKSREKDFDALLIGSNAIVLNETKSTVRQSYIDEFIAFIPTVFEYLPEHQGKKVIPVFSSLYIPENFVAYLTKQGIYAMAMGDETMEILNYNDIPKP